MTGSAFSNCAMASSAVCAATTVYPASSRPETTISSISVSSSTTNMNMSLVKTGPCLGKWDRSVARSEEHTSELQSLMRISYAVFCLKKKKKNYKTTNKLSYTMKQHI